jgi:hypothetical protein
MDEKPDHFRRIEVPEGASVVIVHGSTIFACVSVVLAVLAILTSAGLGKPDLGDFWEHAFWVASVTCALLAFWLERRRKR